MKMDKEEFGKNIGKPSLEVRHADLQRSCEESIYRSKCPVCPEGVLLVRRHHRTARLEKEDRCVFCGQAFIYLDIDKLR